MTLFETILGEVEKIKGKDGIIHPQDLVEISRPFDAPLHDQFEWNDSKAAETYRIWQARQLIAKVKITVEKVEAPAFVNIKIENEKGAVEEQGYFPIAKVLSNETLKKMAIKEAVREIRYWETKYAQYEELSKILNQEEIKKFE